MKNEFDDFDFDDKGNRNLLNIVVIAGAVIIVLVVAVLVMKFALGKVKDESQNTVSSMAVSESTALDETSPANDQTIGENESLSAESSGITEAENVTSGEEVSESVVEKPVHILLSSDATEIAKVCNGIDVSKYQGVINWKKVADSGVEFAMIRVGYRTLDTGEIKEDENARYNLQEATANGIKVGVYFFSTAVNETEAVREAEWVVELIKKYEITYPVAYNCEGYDKSENRHFYLTNEERTNCAKAFLNTVYEAGYTPMFYASKNQMSNSRDWVMSEIECSYKVWLSWYSESTYAQAGIPEYGGSCGIWQYTNTGSIDGIHTSVDKDVAYFGYETVAAAHDQTKPEKVLPDYEALMAFVEANYEATAKNETNLRDIPDQTLDSHVMYTLKHGEKVLVTGFSDSGWSRVIFNGNTYYAVTNLLTTDFSEPEASNQEVQNTPVNEPAQTESGIKTVFADCYETVTPKIEVNLRLLPSVTNPDATVIATVKNGETFTRTGINAEYGWSRVEYNGQTLYCVSSYLWVVSQ